MHTPCQITSDPVTEALVEIGVNIRRARKEAFHESRQAFAKRLGCSPATLDRLETGKPGVSVAHLLAAMQAMQALQDVVLATSPNILIAIQIPVEFPKNFGETLSADFG